MSFDKRDERCEGESPQGATSRRKDLPEIIDDICRSCDVEGVIVHLDTSPIPSREGISDLMGMIEDVLFPGFFGNQKIGSEVLRYHIGEEISNIYGKLAAQMSKAFIHECQRLGKECKTCVGQGEMASIEFLRRIPMIRTLLKGDVMAAFRNDPAAKSYDEIIFSYPGIKAISYYRVAHELSGMGVPIIPRIITEIAHKDTGIDIHPGAKIGENFFIDHGTGTVIGETCEIGDNVVLYQNVTLGSLNFPRNGSGEVIRDLKRHPTVGNNVIIYSGATILGGETKIGDNVVIGGNAWVTYSVPDDTKVMAECPALKMRTK